MRPVRLIVGALLTITGLAPLSAQTGTLRGHVTMNDATHNPIAGVSVTVGGRGTLTLSDGSYTITGVAAGSDSLRARIIGYAPQSKAFTLAGNDTVVVDFALDAQAVNLSEVVVVGYGTQKAGDVTTSIKQVSSSDFNPGNVVSPQALIENKVAGVQVIDNNEPGGGFSVRVRGAASVTAGTDPLYVVDGVPLGDGSGGGLFVNNSTANFTDPLAFLNPNDIESITILKDASASAIYGSNASNGVVLITTKSGRGRSSVEYDGNFSSSSVTRLPSMLNTAQFRAAVIAHDSATGFAQLGNANTDWFGLVDRTGTGTQQNVSMSGSGLTNNYRLSVGYLNQQGILQHSSAQRVSLNAHYDQRLYNDRLNIQANVTGARSYNDETPGGVLYNAAQMGGTQPVFDPAATTGYYNWPGNSLTSPDNPLEVLNTSLDHITTLRSVGNLQAKYDFSQFPALQGLTGTANLGFDVTNIDRVTFYPNNIHLETKNGTDGSFFEQQPTQTKTLLDLYLNYQPQFLIGPGAIDVTGGYSYSQAHTRQPSFSETQITTNLLTDGGIPLGSNLNPQLQDTVTKLISFFGRVGYNIGDKYLFSASIRRDGSSKFGLNNQWGNFPGVSAGWRISQEPFFHVAPISDLKLRASWGKTGNQAINSYLFVSTYQPCSSTAEAEFGNAFVCPFRPSAVDPNIKWESTGTTDVGFDYGLLGSRLTGSFDWYNKHTDDLLFDVPVDPASNLGNFVTTNIGSMKNTGFDFDITARLLDAPRGSNGLSWTASFNMNHNTNELLSINPNAVGGGTIILAGPIAGGVGSTIQVLQPGQPIYSFYTCQQTYQNGKPVEGVYVPNPTDTTGTKTNCKLGTNSKASHDPAPKWIFGFTNTMTYHHFDLSFTLRAWLGNYVYNNVASNLGNWRQLTAGSSPYNLQSSVLTTNFQNQQLFSDYYVENGSFLRMDNIAIGYTFPWAGQQMRVYAIVQNAFTITGYSGVDPTAGTGGIDNNIYPRARTITGGLNVKF